MKYSQFPYHVAKKVNDDKIVDIKFEDIVKGDILIINSGDIIPTV